MTNRYQGTVIENDCLAPLTYAYPRPSTIQSLDTEGHVILCSSFSKTVAPGTRTGWIIPGKYKEKVMHLKYLSHCSGEVFMQQVMSNFLKEGHYFLHLRRMRQQYSNFKASRWIFIMGRASGSRYCEIDGDFTSQ